MTAVVTAAMNRDMTEGKTQEIPAGAADFVRMYQQHLRPVYAYVAWRVGHPETAEDITAHVFEKAWRSRAGYDRQKGAPVTWLMSIARHAVIDHFRQGARSPQATAADPDGDGGDGSGQVDTLRAAGAAASGTATDYAAMPDPLLEVLSAERRQELGTAIRGLEDREREILSLKFGGGLSNREIAGLLEISESNTGTILYRSLEKLRNRLEGVIEDEK